MIIAKAVPRARGSVGPLLPAPSDVPIPKLMPLPRFKRVRDEAHDSDREVTEQDLLDWDSAEAHEAAVIVDASDGT